MARWDLIVVGLGAVGSATLRAAAEAGARVLGLEQFSPANERGSSHGRSRIFRHAYFEHPDYVPLLLHSTARFESLETESGDSLLNRCGMLVMGPAGSATVQGSLDSAARWRLPVQALEAPVLRERFPWFSVADGTLGAFEANAGIVRPEAVVEASVRVARARGAEVRLGTRVLGIVEDDTGVAVQTGAGVVRGSAAVLAAGPWAARLLPELARWLTVTRQVQAWFAPMPAVDASAMPCWLYDRGPERRAIYGLAPDCGGPAAASAAPSQVAHCHKVGLHGSDVVIDPDAGAPPVVGQDIAVLRKALDEVAPRLNGPLVEAATCLYTMSPDTHFLVGAGRGGRRTYFAAGLSGHGFKLSPALGDALADLALRGRTSLPVAFLSPDRFAD